jgi:Flp pilus assembly protein TadG
MLRHSHFVRHAEGGNFAVTFAIMSTVLLGAAGLALDFANQSMMHSKLQNAADAAALAGAGETTKTQSQRVEIAKKMFISNAGGIVPDLLEVTFPAGHVQVTAREKVTNLLGRFLHTETTDIAVTSLAIASAPRSVEIAFALDVSGSMSYSLGSNTRLAALQSAVDTLIDQLAAAASANLTIKAAVIPFTNAVNIGTSNVGYVFNDMHPLFSGTRWLGCVFERPGAAMFSDGDTPKWGAYIWPPMPNIEGQWDYSRPFSNGTMGGYATLAEDPTSKNSRVAGPNYNCTRYPIVPLTADLNKVRSEVSSYAVWSNMGTHIAAGVSWGMRVLSPKEPFSEGAPYSANAQKLLIVITDGEQVTDAEGSDGLAEKSTNSISPWRYDPAEFGLPGKKIDTGYGPMDSFGPYGFVRDSQPFGATDTDAPNAWEQNLDQLAKSSTMACDEVKKGTGGRKIEVFTLGVSTDTKPGTRVYDTLRNCASTPDNHYYVTDMTSLNAAFEDILKTAKIVRLTQ